MHVPFKRLKVKKVRVFVHGLTVSLYTNLQADLYPAVLTKYPSLRGVQYAHRLKSMMFNILNPMKSNISASTSTDDKPGINTFSPRGNNSVLPSQK
jgi:hypothetical protein